MQQSSERCYYYIEIAVLQHSLPL